MKFDLSFVVPVFNEAEVIDELMSKLKGIGVALAPRSFEVLLIDDGSTDRTLEILRSYASQDRRVRVLSFSRNFGHQSAISAGLDHAAGDWVLVMDGDLQDPPELVHEFFAKAAEGYDVVYAIRATREGGIWKKACYRLFYRFLALLSQTPIPLDSGDFALMSRPVVNAIKMLPERDKFIRGLRAWVGFRQAGIAVHRPVRRAGRSKYTVIKLFKLAADGLFSFSALPLRLAGVVGLLSLILSFLFVAYAVVMKIIFDASPTGFTALLIVIVFMGSVQLICLGVAGEYLGRLYDQQKARPVYIVKEEINGEH